MSKVKVELISEGVRALLHSAEVQACISEHGSQVAARAMNMAQVRGAEYAAELISTPTRAVSRVYPANGAAVKDNRDNNTLLNALHGGG